jgi:hypothetical protein
MSTSLIEVGDEITVDYQTVEKELSFNDGFFVNTIKPIPPLKNYGTETKRDNLTI